MDINAMTIFPDISYSAVATSVASFAAGIVVKTILDLRLGILMVKYLGWIRPRWIFGANPYELSGTWDQEWGSGGSVLFANDVDRHGHPKIWQLGSYCYVEFISKSKTYYCFGRVVGAYFIGEWFDVKDRTGYYGTFELRIVNSDQMQGKWIGHSQTASEIRVDDWQWKRVSS